MTMVTDEMTGAAIEAVWEAVKTDNPPDGWTDWIDDRVMHAVLEAVLAVMPVPDDDVDDPNYTIPLLGEPAFVTRGVPVGGTPTDAEFEAGLISLSGSATRYGAETMSPRYDPDEWRAAIDALNTEVVEKRRTLLAMHAQARLAGLDDIRLDIHARGFNAGWREALEQLREWAKDEYIVEVVGGEIGPREEGYNEALDDTVNEIDRRIDAMLGGSHE